MTSRTNSLIITAFLLLLFCLNSFGQIPKISSEKIYALNLKIEVPGTIGLLGGTLFGFEYLTRKSTLELEEVLSLNRNNIWWFDRIATKQDASFRNRAHNISDFFLNSSVLLPGVLAFDDKIRKDCFDLLVLYGETHAINTSFYILNAGFISRTRPFCYHPDVPPEDKLARETRNSFFSGHVSSAASASFFMAKVYSDYHPEMGNKKYWLYAAAVIPPSLVGYYRFRAMKHFPTDILLGFGIGAAAGVLIPEMHRIKENGSQFTFVPFAGRYNGLQVSYTFR